MEENYNHIDQIIRQKFENFEPEPPVQVWEKIRSGINKTPPPSSSTGFVMPIIVAVSLLVFIAGLVHNIYFKDTRACSHNPQCFRSFSPAGRGHFNRIYHFFRCHFAGRVLPGSGNLTITRYFCTKYCPGNQNHPACCDPGKGCFRTNESG